MALKHIILSLFMITGLFADTPTFSDIPWGSSFASAKSILASKGYVSDPKQGENAFIGMLVGIKTQVFVYEAPGKRVSKVIVHLLTSDDAAISTYKNIKGILTKRLGEPEIVKADFKPPFAIGDGNEPLAIKSEKATVLTIWPYNEDKSCGVMVEITPKLTVQVTYEANVWAEHIRKMRSIEAQVL